MENFDTACLAIRSVKIILDYAGTSAINPDLAFAVQNVLDEAYRATAEMEQEIKNLNRELEEWKDRHACLYKEYLDATAPKAPEPDPD